MNLEVFKQYLLLKDAKADLEAELEKVKERMQLFQELIMEEFVENGVDKLSVDGRLVFPKSQLYASCRALTEEVKSELRSEGAADLIQEAVNGQRLSSYVREYMRDNDIKELTGLPDWMKNNFSITEKVTIGVRG